MKKICFVIMGFGKKSDPYSGRTLDLDKTYLNIIRPTVEAADLICVRADEIQDSGLIDKSMYVLLMHADLVIADISTYNPNAIYELGVRHAVRPFSTIIIKEQQGKIPFDLDHNRIFNYDHMGDDIGATEAQRCKDQLLEKIRSVLSQNEVDSPLYELINGISAPLLPEGEYRNIIRQLAKDEKFIFWQRERALTLMAENNFVEAEKFWSNIAARGSNDPYFVQQQALCRYKSKYPSEKTALIDALKIISALDPDGDTTDPETLGITGAIYKNLFRADGDIEFLNHAIDYYGKCFVVRKDYYTGENYAHCLEEKCTLVKDDEERIYSKVLAKKTRESIVEDLLKTLQFSQEKRADQYWIHATLSNCFLALGLDEKAKEFEDLFKNEQPLDWEVVTFTKTKNEILNRR